VLSVRGLIPLVNGQWGGGTPAAGVAGGHGPCRMRVGGRVLGGGMDDVGGGGDGDEVRGQNALGEWECVNREWSGPDWER
jgi:hypothetical protein